MLIWDRIHCRWIEWRGSAAAWRALPHASIIGTCAKVAALGIISAGIGVAAGAIVAGWPGPIGFVSEQAIVVPEPSTALLLLAGIAIIIVVRWKNN